MKTSNTTPFSKLAKPAQRALAGAGIKTIDQLALLTEGELMQYMVLAKMPYKL